MQYPPNVAPSVVFPLLTEQALQLLTQEVTREEDQLWNSLGDAWNIPRSEHHTYLIHNAHHECCTQFITFSLLISRSKWPNAEQIPPYVPQFYDGWQPPAPAPAQLGPMNQPLSRSNSQRFPAENGIQQRPGQVTIFRLFFQS